MKYVFTEEKRLSNTWNGSQLFLSSRSGVRLESKSRTYKKDLCLSKFLDYFEYPTNRRVFLFVYFYMKSYIKIFYIYWGSSPRKLNLFRTEDSMV